MALQRLAVKVVEVPVYRREVEKVQSKYGVFESVHSKRDGTMHGTVEVLVDVDAIIAKMARSALLGKAGKSSYMQGAVQVKTLDRKRSDKGKE